MSGTTAPRQVLAARRASYREESSSSSSSSSPSTPARQLGGGGGAAAAAPRPSALHGTASARSRNPRLEGYLYKKTKGIKGVRHFQKRWVVLYPDSCVIAYYRKRKDADKEFHVRNNMGVTVMPWAAAGIIPVDIITSVFPTGKSNRFDITVSRAAGKTSKATRTYQWKCTDQHQRDLWVEAIALVHQELQRCQDQDISDDFEDGLDAAAVAAAAADSLSAAPAGDDDGEQEDRLLPLRPVLSVGAVAAAAATAAAAVGVDGPDGGAGAGAHRTRIRSNQPGSGHLRKHSRHYSTASNSSTRSARSLNSSASEVIDRLLTTDRFASLRPPPSTAQLQDAPTMAESVGRSLVGADHMPHSGDSAMEDSDSSDDYDTDEVSFWLMTGHLTVHPCTHNTQHPPPHLTHPYAHLHTHTHTHTRTLIRPTPTMSARCCPSCSKRRQRRPGSRPCSCSVTRPGARTPRPRFPCTCARTRFSSTRRKSR